MIFFNRIFLEIFGSFLIQKIDIESQNFAHFDNFYSADRKTKKLLHGLVIDFGPRERLGRMCDTVH